MAESPSELQAEIEKLERKHSENPEGRYFVPLANAYRKAGELEQAEQLLREGLRRHPDYLSAHIVLGRCLADRQANREAGDEFRYVLSLDAQNLIALRTLGELALADQRPDEAARWFNELLAVDPMNEDARRALESLNASASAADASEEFQQGASWWERPAEAEGTVEAAPEGEAAPAPQEYGMRDVAAPIEEPAAEEPGAVETHPPEPEEPAPFRAAPPVEEYGMAWATLDEADAGAEPADALPPVEEQAPDERLVAVDGGSGLWRSSEPGDEAEEESPELVTETIAELYARQGLYDRSMEVYRELIRRRGGSEALERRLAEVERLAAGGAGAAGGLHAEPAPTGPHHPADEPAAEPEESLPGATLPLHDELAAAPEADGEQDAFAASFLGGFGTQEQAAAEDAEPTSAAPLDQQAPAEAFGSTTIAELLGRLAQWRPGSPASPPAAPPQPAPATEPAGGADEGPGGEAFPWELSSAEGPAAEPQPQPEPQPEPADDEGGFTLEGLDEAPAAASAEPQPSVPPAPAPAPEPAAEEDDLESFQAWLRSLKR